MQLDKMPTEQGDDCRKLMSLPCRPSGHLLLPSNCCYVHQITSQDVVMISVWAPWSIATKLTCSVCEHQRSSAHTLSGWQW